MKICIGQINTTPGDFEGNFIKIRTGIDAAVADGADIVIFPELCLSGYLSQDLIYHPAYIEQNLRYLSFVKEHACSADPQLVVVVGYINKSAKKSGKPFANMAAVIRGGKVEITYQKRLLPFYDVFDELRYFEPGQDLSVFEIEGEKIGIAICEDLWNDKGSDDYSYADNPLQQYRDAGINIIVSLNSSPFIQGKLWDRLQMISGSSDDELTIIYVNQIGGQDELVFDGQSFIVRNGDLLYLNAERRQDSYETIDLEQVRPIIQQVKEQENRQAIIDTSCSLQDMLVLCLRDYAVKSGFDELIVASSGGVDSAVVCLLAVEALGAKNVHAIRMPSRYSSQHSRDDALNLHQQLGCWDYLVPVEHSDVIDMLNNHYSQHRNNDANLVTRKMTSGQYNSVADENIQARMRDLYVMHFSNAFGAMPLSTGNKTESACGYYTHFDMNFSFAPIKDLYKYEVVKLAQQDKRIPSSIWQKPPSAELAVGQIDEDSLLPYAILDPIVKAYIEDYVSTFSDFEDWVSQQSEWMEISSDRGLLQKWLLSVASTQEYRKITKLIGKMEYKRRQTCPGTKVSRVAFGIGRRIPIVEKWS